MKIENIIAPMTGIGAGLIGANAARVFTPKTQNPIIKACTTLGTICIADMLAVAADNHARNEIAEIREYFRGKEEEINERIEVTTNTTESD